MCRHIVAETVPPRFRRVGPWGRASTGVVHGAVGVVSVGRFVKGTLGGAALEAEVAGAGGLACFAVGAGAGGGVVVHLIIVWLGMWQRPGGNIGVEGGWMVDGGTDCAASEAEQ